MLLEKNKLLLKQNDVTSTFTEHFRSITDSLSLFSWPKDTSVSSGNDKINFIIKKTCLCTKYKNNKEKN